MTSIAVVDARSSPPPIPTVPSDMIGRDQAEDVVVGVEQVAAATDARPILGRQRFGAAELDPARHEPVDVIDADDDVAAVHARPDLGPRALSLDQAAVDAVPGGAGDVADRAFARVDRPSTASRRTG